MNEILRFQSSGLVSRERVAWMINTRTSVHLKVEDVLFGDSSSNLRYGIIFSVSEPATESLIVTGPPLAMEILILTLSFQAAM